MVHMRTARILVHVSTMNICKITRFTRTLPLRPGPLTAMLGNKQATRGSLMKLHTLYASPLEMDYDDHWVVVWHAKE